MPNGVFPFLLAAVLHTIDYLPKYYWLLGQLLLDTWAFIQGYLSISFRNMRIFYAYVQNSILYMKNFPHICTL